MACEPDFKPWLVERFFAGTMEVVAYGHGSVETVHEGGESFYTEAAALARVPEVAAERKLTLSPDGKLPGVIAAGVLHSLTAWRPPDGWIPGL